MLALNDIPDAPPSSESTGGDADVDMEESDTRPRGVLNALPRGSARRAFPIHPVPGQVPPGPEHPALAPSPVPSYVSPSSRF